MRYLLRIYTIHTSLFYPFMIQHRAMGHLPKVYVKHDSTEEKMKIYFTFGLPELPNRIFTFIRPTEEKLEVTISRMKLKMLEAITKKVSKRRKKAPVNSNDEEHPQVSLMIHLSKEGKLINGDVINADAWTENTEVKINDCVYEVAKNPPSVLHLSLPKSIMSGFPVYPRIQLEYCEKEDCDFSWFRSVSKSEKLLLSSSDSSIVNFQNENWLFLSNNYFYVTSESDVGCKLRVTCVPKCGDKSGLEEVTVSAHNVELGPSDCPFEDRHEYTKELTSSGEVRCVSYNILADLYADSDTARNHLFPYCPTEALMLDYRRQLYLKEIIGYNADIICLQEVDRKVFHGDLVPILTSTGLEGIYSEKGGQVVEGLSCFYRTSKFKKIESHSIILSEAVMSDPVLQPILSKLSENEKLKERFMNRTTAIQVVLLESLDVPQKRILVANTHLYFHPDSDNIRLIQATTCILYLQNLLSKYQKEDDSYTTSLLLNGDFNSCPEFGVYKLMTTGSLSEECVDWQSNSEEIVAGMPLSHTLQLDSACGTPQYTNFTEGFAGCLDYIFYDRSQFKVSNIVPFPEHSQVIKYRALPNKVFPSDHIALICTLQWK